MRAGVPVVPIAVVGAEESMPILFKSTRLAEAARTPVLPGHRQHADVRARSGWSRYFPAKFRIRVLPPVHFDVAPDQERYSRSRVMDESERIRRRSRTRSTTCCARRRSVWFG